MILMLRCPYGHAFCSGRWWIATSALLVLAPAHAFDPTTHAAMTSEAVAASQITRDPNAGTILGRLGIVDFPFNSGLLDRSLGKNYVYQGSVPSPVVGMPIETAVMRKIRQTQTGLEVADDFSVSGWFMRGAIREDDNTSETPNADDPGGVFDRVFGHFFDPVVNRGLTVSLLGTQPRAVDWALLDSARVQPILGGTRANQFKISDAREAMWRALTLKTGAWTDDVVPSGWNTLPSTREAIRKAYWSTTFRALGDVVHLLQDMAQPQHTRNDAHSGRMCVPGVGCKGGHASFFENYLVARTASEPSFSLEEGVGGIVLSSLQVNIRPSQLNYADYSPPRFLSYADYFSKGVNAEGQGLANYSNRGFYSFGTNINSAGATPYPAPSPTGSGLGFATVTTGLTDRFGRPVTGSVTFRTGSVQDKVNTALTESNVKLSAMGLFDQFLTERNASWSQYTLNYVNYDAQADLLIPRAVAYSAGLIDYFFRGQLYVAPPAEGVFGLVDHGDPASNCKDTCGFAKIKLRAANSTPDITPPGGTATPQGMTGGVVVAVAKYRRNNCYTPDLAGEYHGSGGDAEKIAYYNSCVAPQPEEITVSDALNVSSIPPCNGDCDVAALPYTFNFQSPIPINAASLSLQLVYRGVLGAESDAVVVQTVDVTEPSYYVYMNASDYIKLGQSVYTPAEINADSGLRGLVRPTSCIVNDQLSPTCFPPIELNFSLLWGDPAPTTTGLTAPLALAAPKEFSRFAMIAPTGVDAVVNQSASPCLPSEPSRFPGRELQERFVPVGTPPSYQQTFAVSPMSTARAVNTTYAVGCVENGDGVLQGPDDRFVKMAPLVGAELTPKPLVGFSFGN